MNNDCRICLEQFSPGDDIVTLANNHRFHRECLRNWCKAAARNSGVCTCPLCREKIPNDMLFNLLYPSRQEIVRFGRQNNVPEIRRVADLTVEGYHLDFDLKQMKVEFAEIKDEIAHQVDDDSAVEYAIELIIHFGRDNVSEVMQIQQWMNYWAIYVQDMLEEVRHLIRNSQHLRRCPRIIENLPSFESIMNNHSNAFYNIIITVIQDVMTNGNLTVNQVKDVIERRLEQLQDSIFVPVINLLQDCINTKESALRHLSILVRAEIPSLFNNDILISDTI